MSLRTDGRRPEELRAIRITPRFTRMPAGSVLIQAGDTHVLCTASIIEGVPKWREASGKGWLTAEYEMVPGATPQRKSRSREKIDGRTREIERLIGRSLRTAVDLARIGPRTLAMDCEVLQADGGTRTAAINGAYIALRDAVAEGVRRSLWGPDVLRTAVAAISVGVVGGRVLLDLNYEEDVEAEADANLVTTANGEWIEVQVTGERRGVKPSELSEMLAIGQIGLNQILQLQRATPVSRP